jgi:hypothetical protein
MSISTLLLLAFVLQPDSEKEFTIKEQLKPGDSVEVSASVNLTGTLNANAVQAKTTPNPAKGQSTTIRASAQAHYRERFIGVDPKTQASTIARRYLAASVERQRGEGKQTIELRSDVQRIALDRVNDQSTIFCPDGPLTAPELDLLRAEVFVPALQGLLPSQPTKIGEQWSASATAASELTGVEPIQSGKLQCTLQDVKTTDDGTMARISFSGTLVGPTDQGPTKLSVEGHVMFDFDLQLISRLVMNGRSEILDASGRHAGRLDGRYELTRRSAIDDPTLTDSALKDVELKPTPDCTALLFDGSSMGVRFLYPRNWELTAVTMSTIQFDEPTGGNMRLTIGGNSSSDKLRSELVAWLKQQKATITANDPVEKQTLSESLESETFTVRAEHQQKDKEWTYMIVRNGDRSISIGCNLIQDRAEILRGDLLFLARSVKFVEK